MQQEALIDLPPAYTIDITSEDCQILRTEVVRIANLYERARTDIRYVLSDQVAWGNLMEHLQGQVTRDPRQTGELIALNLSTQIDLNIPQMRIHLDPMAQRTNSSPFASSSSIASSTRDPRSIDPQVGDREDGSQPVKLNQQT